jgi:hypothetical protein
MSGAARVSVVACFFVLVAIGLALQPGARETSRTSFGRVPEGFGALYDWLLALGLPAARSYRPPEDLPAAQTVWWLEPHVDCDGAALQRWVERGGTAVIVPAAGDAQSACALPDVAIPERRVAEASDAAATDTLVTGELTSEPRAIGCGPLATFDPATDWKPLARLGDRPFVLERALGAGRLVLVADVAFLENRCFAEGDAAPLAGDLVRSFGPPWLDERSHGLRAPRGVVATLAHSRAVVFLALAGLVGVLYLWHGALVPPRRLQEPSLPAPTLDAFVDSLARLYAATGDHARVLERYRELTASRLRRLFGLPPDTPPAQLLARLGRRPALSRDGLAALTSTRRAASRADLEREVTLLDQLVREAAR